MDETDQIMNQIVELFLKLDFKKVTIEHQTGNEINYVFGNTYCVPHYFDKLGFLVEYADSLEEAQKFLYEDGDSFPLEIGPDAVLKGLEEEIRFNISRRYKVS